MLFLNTNTCAIFINIYISENYILYEYNNANIL
jgi:hypothetical protein